MSFFVTSVVTPPAHLPISSTDTDLAAAVVDEVERMILWRAVVSQVRRITIDGPLPSRIELEPLTAIVGLTMWTPTDPAAVIDAASYTVVSRDPLGTIIVPNSSWPAPERSIGSFALTYSCGWEVTPESTPGAGDSLNSVPSSVKLMLERAIKFRAGSGVGDLTIGSLKIGLADSYKTDRIPPEIASIGRAWAYRPGIFYAAR